MNGSIQPGTLISRRDFIAAACVGVATLTLCPKNAFATQWGSQLTTSSGGVTYYYSCGIDGGANPVAHTKARSSQTVAAGTMKVQARLAQGMNGNVVASSKVKSNARGTSVSTSISKSSLASGFRSVGLVWIHDTPLSCTPIVAASLANELPINANGQTYGSAFDDEQGLTPDLLAVVADSGLEGYVLYEQFVDENAPDQIPVYDVEGETVIGTFTFGDK